MIEENSPPNLGEAMSPERLAAAKVIVVYTMYHHLGDFVVMGGLLRKFDLLGVGFESLVAHRGSPHAGSFEGGEVGRFFDVATLGGMVELRRKLRERRRAGGLVLGIPMAPGSVQAFGFFWMLKRLGALDYIVDFNLINADVLTPPRRRYIFDRHLAQAAELFKRPEWLEDLSMPLAVGAAAAKTPASPLFLGDGESAVAPRRIGFFPWSGRGRLPEFRWPEARWAELAQLIFAQFDGEIVLLGKDDGFSRFEQALRARLPAEMRPRFIGRPAAAVPALVAELRELSGLVTLNTSALHIAHALQLPTVALCGSSLEIWLPEGDHIRPVRDAKGVLPPSDKAYHDSLQPSLQRIATAEVYNACRELFSFSGAGARP
jgi:ADP-heptose:LPS heptosyltransferase